MLNIGCHLSSSKGFYHMGCEALSIDANTFQFFTRNPRGGSAKEIDPDDAQKLNDLIKEKNFAKILAHAPYTLNACAEKEYVREFAHNTMLDDLKRMEFVPGNLYNFHPGSHVGQGIEKGIEMISNLLNSIMWKEQTTRVLLETMSGKGSEVGSKFEELREIIDRVELDDKMGVCLDTCHVFDAGYDLVGDPDGVLAEFDRVVGLDRLRALHLNDSKNAQSSHKDRHECIGDGNLGLATFERIINHPLLAGIPMILETPNELPGYQKEIALLRGMEK